MNYFISAGVFRVACVGRRRRRRRRCSHVSQRYTPTVNNPGNVWLCLTVCQPACQTVTLATFASGKFCCCCCCWCCCCSCSFSCCCCRVLRSLRQLCVEISCCCRLLLAVLDFVGCRTLLQSSISLNCGSYEHGILIISLDWLLSLVVVVVLAVAVSVALLVRLQLFWVAFSTHEVNIRRTFLWQQQQQQQLSCVCLSVSVCILHLCGGVWLRKCQVKWLHCRVSQCVPNFLHI